MLGSVLIEDLAASPTQIWRRRIEQAEIIGPLAKLERISTADLQHACSALSISRRHFFNLLKKHRQRLAGGPARGCLTGVHFHVDEVTESIIAEAISTAGPAARYTDVYARAQMLSRERGLKPPTKTSVRTRFCKHRPGIDLVKRLQIVDCSLIADMCPLELALLAADGSTKGAWLLAFFATSTGKFVHHDLLVGRPTHAQGLETFSEAVINKIGPPGERIGLTSALSELNLLGLSFGNGSTTAVGSRSRKLVGGSAIRAVCGHSLGRIRIRNEGSCWTGDLPPAVPIASARLVTTQIVRHLNSRTAV